MPEVQIVSRLGENSMLKALGENQRNRLLLECTRVRLKRRTILYRAGETARYCYFPVNGVMSLLSTTENGKSVIIGVVGNEGIAGIAALLQPAFVPYEIMAQIETNALRIEAKVIRKEFRQSDRFQQIVMNYLRLLLLQISQSAVCHSFHTVEQRLACWLLITSDRTHTNQFSLTQQCISQMLGTPRTNVSMIANVLQKQGLIYSKRGTINIVEREELEDIACECYRIVKNQIDEFFQQL
jgi:CRP-like cAMP-binding protein